MVTAPDVNVLTLVMRKSSGFYSVQSTLEYKVAKEDKDARFSCEVSFFVPGAIRTVESSSVNITVHCEWSLLSPPLVWDSAMRPNVKLETVLTLCSCHFSFVVIRFSLRFWV